MKLAAWTSLAIFAACCFSAPFLTQSVSSSLTKIGDAPIAQNHLPECAQPCVTQLVHNTSCTTNNYTCLCDHGLFGDNTKACFHNNCITRDYLLSLNVTANDCGIAQRSQPPLVKITSIVLGPLALISVILRLSERPGGQRKLRDTADDLIMLVNGVFVVAFTAVGIELTDKGMGRDAYTLPIDTLETVMKLLLAHEVLYVVIIHLTKLVILCVYLRILPLHTMPLLRFLVPITKAVVAAAGFGQAVALIFQCTPVHYFWDRLKDARSGGHCINVNAWGWANAAINLLMDFWIIALPLPEIFKLKLYWKEKVKVTLMLAVGSLVVVVAIPRLIFMPHFQQDLNPTWTISEMSFISVLEAYISVICTCLPRNYMLFSRLYRKYWLKAEDPRKDSLPGSMDMDTLQSRSQSTAANNPEPTFREMLLEEREERGEEAVETP